LNVNTSEEWDVQSPASDCFPTLKHEIIIEHPGFATACGFRLSFGVDQAMLTRGLEAIRKLLILTNR